MEKKYLNLKKKPANRKHQNRGKAGKVVIMVINTTPLTDNVKAGVDSVTTIDGQGNVLTMCQKWLRDDSDATPTKLPDGPAKALNYSPDDLTAFAAAVAGVNNPLIVEQFGVAAADVNNAVVTAASAPAASIQLGVPVKDGNTTNPGANYPLAIAGGTGTNAVALQYSQDGGKTWNNFGTGSNVADGTTPLDVPNPTGVTGSTCIQAVLTVGGVNFTSNVITVNF